MYDPNEDPSLQRLLDVVTHEQLKDMYANLYMAYQDLRLSHNELLSNQSWEASAKHAERSGGWL